ncbi:hypothetical protein [Barnesiella intestinihominis]
MRGAYGIIVSAAALSVPTLAALERSHAPPLLRFVIMFSRFKKGKPCAA